MGQENTVKKKARFNIVDVVVHLEPPTSSRLKSAAAKERSGGGFRP